jgi:hypothetical protein
MGQTACSTQRNRLVGSSAFLDATESEAASRLQATYRGHGARVQAKLAQAARVVELQAKGAAPIDDTFWRARRGSRRASITADIASEANAFEQRRASLLARLGLNGLT